MMPINLLSGQNAEQVLQYLATISLKVSLVLALTLVAIWLLRHSSAALRHWMLTLALVATLVLPIAALISPSWALALLPSLPTSIDLRDNRPASRTIDPLYKSNLVKSFDKPLVAQQVAVTPAIKISNQTEPIKPSIVPSASAASPLPISTWLLVAWLLGMSLSLVRWLWQYGTIWNITRHGITPDAAWNGLLATHTRRLGLRRPVRLIFSSRVRIPMTWGWRRPSILLPCDAYEWEDERRSVVLLHELAHVVRHDYLTQWLALVCCVLHWFNPLVWWTARQMTVEREQASDDLVLKTGVRSTEYATHLLAIARNAIHRSSFQMLTLATARRSELERRIRGILNPYQHRQTHWRTRLLLVIVLCLSVMPLSGLRLTRANAQSDSIVLTLSMNGQQEALMRNGVFAQFEADHPGVKIAVADGMRVSDAADNLDGHFNAMEQYANSADVLFFESSNMSLTPLDTRARYVLDMAPLINADTTFPLDDFYSQLWSSFQWDQGIWAIPFGADMVLMNYDQAAFDRENMAYPDGQWTFDNFLDAVKQLTVKDTSGNVIAAGFANSGRIFREAFWRSLMDADAVDANSLPNQPQFLRADVEAVLNNYHLLEAQGLINGDANSAAMFIDSARRAPLTGYGWSLLPGNSAVLLPYGLAISAGTQHPDLAYELIKFLSSQRDLSGGIPARKSLTELEGIGAGVMPEWRPVIEAGFANSLTYSNLRFSDYLNAAGGSSEFTREALQTAETRAIDDLKVADAKRDTLVLSVTAPTVPTLPEGKIALNFDILAFKQPNDTYNLWNGFAQDFAATDPQVGLVNLRPVADPASTSAVSSDCFYSASNAVPSIAPELLLPLDPLLDADASFNRDDLIGNALTAVQSNGATLALPLNLNPLVMHYDGARFAAATLPEPSAGWTVEDFVAALDALKSTSAGHAPFVDNGSGGTYLLVLMASYGALPLDYRTNPPTVNFTDTATVDGIRQVLDLAKHGGITYSALGNFGDGMIAFPNDTTAIYSSMLDGFGRKLPPDAPPDKAALFPTGREYNGVAYDLGAGYISAQTPYPEACYRLLSALAQHPELFPAMPVRHSMLTSSAFQATATPDLLAMYQQISSLLSDPRTVAFPTDGKNTPSVTNFLLQHWLFQAFDTYVIDDGDLDAALANAAQMATTYQTCTADLPSIDPGVDVGGDNSALKPYITCAELADSSLKELFEPLTGS